MSTPSGSRVVALLVGVIALLPAVARAEHAQRPDELIALDTPPGEKLLAESTARADFFRLVDTFVTQERPSFCGVASAVMALNALHVPAPSTEVGPLFTQQNFFGPAAHQVVPSEARFGLTLGQLADVLQTYAAHADVVYADGVSLDEMRTRLAGSLADPSDVAIVNYDRAGVGQESMGHLSPLGAYHAPSDRFLLLDVARYKYPPVWVTAESLYRAMRTNDPVSGRSRGFLLVTATQQVPGPAGRASARSVPLLMAGLIGLGFLVGFVAGTLFGRARARARERRAGS
jgi:hypothetical protein